MKTNLKFISILIITAIASTVFTKTIVEGFLMPSEKDIEIGMDIGSITAKGLGIEPTDNKPTLAIYKKDQKTPSRIIIPSLGIDASVKEVGMAVKGNMAVPKSYTLESGSDIYVVTEDSTTLHFTVSHVKTFPRVQAPTDVIFNEVD